MPYYTVAVLIAWRSSTLLTIITWHWSARSAWSFWWCWTIPSPTCTTTTPPTRKHCVTTCVSTRTSTTWRTTGSIDCSTRSHFEGYSSNRTMTMRWHLSVAYRVCFSGQIRSYRMILLHADSWCFYRNLYSLPVTIYCMILLLMHCIRLRIILVCILRLIIFHVTSTDCPIVPFVPFVRCVFQGCPVHLMGNEARCFVEIYGPRKNPESANKYMKFGRLNIRKIINIISTKCHLLRLKCTKFDSKFNSCFMPICSFVRLCLRWSSTWHASACISPKGPTSLPDLWANQGYLVFIMFIVFSFIELYWVVFSVSFGFVSYCTLANWLAGKTVILSWYFSRGRVSPTKTRL